MDLDRIRSHCLGKKGTEETFPFDSDTQVFKVVGKIFAAVSLEKKVMSLRFDPETALALREKYADVTPARYFNKNYWNTIDLQGRVPEKEIVEWIDGSYRLVAAGLPKKDRLKTE